MKLESLSDESLETKMDKCWDKLIISPRGIIIWGFCTLCLALLEVIYWIFGEHLMRPDPPMPFTILWAGFGAMLVYSIIRRRFLVCRWNNLRNELWIRDPTA